jgi:hypothetical protein
MRKYPWTPVAYFSDEGNTGLLLVAGLAALFFLLEFFGNELMNTAGLLAKVIGFFLAYPLACLVPIAFGWWLIHREPPDRNHW